MKVCRNFKKKTSDSFNLGHCTVKHNLGIQKNDSIPAIALQEKKYVDPYLIIKLFLFFFL